MATKFRGKNPSERRACLAFQVNRAGFRYSHKEENPAIVLGRKEILQLAGRQRKSGTPRITWRLQKCGHRVNHKQVERLYALEKLQIPRK
jgi:putative transposase